MNFEDNNNFQINAQSAACPQYCVLVHATDAILIICTFYIFWFCNAVGAIR